MQRCNTALVRQASVSLCSRLTVWESHTFDVHILNYSFSLTSWLSVIYLYINPAWFKYLIYVVSHQYSVKSEHLLLFKQNKIKSVGGGVFKIFFWYLIVLSGWTFLIKYRKINLGITEWYIMRWLIMHE